MKKTISVLFFALIGHFSYSQNYTPQESNKRSIYLMPIRVDSVASSAYKRVITRYLNGAYGTVVSASTSTSTGSATFGGGIGVADRASLASAVVNTTLSVNGMATGATTDTTVVVNAGVLKKVLRSRQVDYAAWSGTDTWDGSAPSGTETHLYGYKVEGKTVTGWIRLEYSSGGATNTYVEIELSAFPTPAIPAYVGSGELAFAANGFLATSNTSNPVASRAWLYESSGALKLKILAASNGCQFAMATFTYQIP